MELFGLLFKIFAAITGLFGIIFWGCLLYLVIQCVRLDLIGAWIRYLERR